MKKTLKEMTLRERFDARGFSPQAYAKAYSIEKDRKSVSSFRDTLYDVFAGRSTGKHSSTPKGGTVRKIIAQLKKDKVWIGPLPWEV